MKNNTFRLNPFPRNDENDRKAEHDHMSCPDWLEI